MTREILIVTTKSQKTIQAPLMYTLEQVLLANKLPGNLFQAYLKNKSGKATPIVLQKKLSDISNEVEIVVKCIRNIDFSVLLSPNSSVKSIESPVHSIEDIQFNGKEYNHSIVELDEETAQEIVQKCVGRFCEKYMKGEKVIVGVSGGGDSNALIHSLNSINNIKPIFFTLVFEPFWNQKAAKRAQDICKVYSVDHLIITEKDLEERLGLKGSLRNFFEEFSELYGYNSTEFFATYLVSKVSRQLCKEYKAQTFCLGYNREDVLAEMLFSLVNGNVPLSFPIRDFGRIQLAMPLWEVPKKILDSCYPKYSLENYLDRIQETTPQRHLIYYLSHQIDNCYSNMGLSLMDGVQNIFNKKWPKLLHDTENDLFVEQRDVNSKTSLEFIKLYRKYFSKL